MSSWTQLLVGGGATGLLAIVVVVLARVVAWQQKRHDELNDEYLRTVQELHAKHVLLLQDARDAQQRINDRVLEAIETFARLVETTEKRRPNRP